MSAQTVGLLSLGLLIVLLLAKLPVAFVMLALGMGGLYIIKGAGSMFVTSSSVVFGTFSSYFLVVVPLFTWMGYIGFHSGISAHLYEAAYKTVGRLKGGLAMATTMACAAFGAICGSTTATSATFASLAMPEMKQRGYSRGLAGANVAASGILGVLIPPSVIFIVYASFTAQSISRLFLAGIVPGLILMVLFMGGTFLRVFRHPEIAPAGESFPWKERIKAVATGGIEVVIIFVAVIGMLVGKKIWPGFPFTITGTEAGSMGCFATLVVVLARRLLTWQGFLNSLKDTVRTATMVMFLVAGAAIFGTFLELTYLPQVVAGWLVALPLPPTVTMIAILLMLMALGCFVDALAMILLTIPIFFPAAMALGFNPIWFGVIMTLALGMGVLTPPVGANVYVVFAVDKETPVMEIFRETWPYLISIWILCGLLLLFPQIALWLPGLTG
ncbi:MAG: TRAP transporter large permease [Dehalococcoidia bacterium]